MFDTAAIGAIAGIFLVAGAVKGVVGLGLPTVSLALLTLVVDLPGAMALLLVPSLTTNLWQAMLGGNGRVLLIRLWPFLVMAAVTVWVGASALTRINLVLSSILSLRQKPKRYIANPRNAGDKTLWVLKNRARMPMQSSRV